VIAGRRRRDVLARAEELLDLVGLFDRRGVKPSELSGGEQQRVAIARALVMRPALLLADEPTGNVDTATATQILLTIKRLQAETGQTIVLATHDARSAAFADEIVLIRDGRIAGNLPLDGWTTPEALSVTSDRLGDDRMRVVLSWLHDETHEESQPRRQTAAGV
jgi:ABC-type lipoprotein export system ATPase subunit